ncbi:MAG: hypothetical protein JSU98_07195 [Gemmatimonadales bacterium]|nr:MAG: hypothetical protein JSU98_07195 [Gemmatimonadales bacterium]
MIQLIILLVLLIPILAIVLDSQLGRALAARLEGRSIPAGDKVTHERIAYLEGEVERLGSELTRLEEESEFLHKLLTERSSGDTVRGSLTEGEDHEQD